MSVKKIINVYEHITINNLSRILNVEPQKIIEICISLGVMVTINYMLNKELILLICNELGYKVNIKNINDDESFFNQRYLKEKKIINRPPIVAVLGHVDHGKTSLLDYIRKINTTSKEPGNITQNIEIFNIDIKKSISITFIDTPGHQSFISMRNRGLKITDIVVIVISSDSGIMEQTIECINNAKSENKPIIFVFTKIDKKNSDVNKIKEELSKINILVDDWGGEYVTQEVSVINGYGIKDLLEKIILISKKINLSTDLNVYSSGTIIESSLDKGKGYISKILVQNGILRQGDYIIAGTNYGKIKKMYYGNNIFKEVYPSYPVYIIGLDGAPSSGDKFFVLNNEKKIKKILNKKKLFLKNSLDIYKGKSFDENTLNIIIKSDVDGSLDVISDELEKLSNENKININIIKKSVGNINVSDILLADISKSIIIGFNVKKNINKKYNQPINNIFIFNIIYDILDFIKKKIKEIKGEKILTLGKAKVLQIFKKYNKKIFGCIVQSGIIKKENKIKILRNNKVIFDGNILSIKRFNKNLLEVKEGNDFGIIIDKYDKINVGDIIVSYKI